MKRSICLILTVAVFIASSYGAMAAENKTTEKVVAEPTPCACASGVHEYEPEVIKVGDCKNDTERKRVCKNCKAEVVVTIPAKHTWKLGEKNKLECSVCQKKPSISATLVSEDKTLFDGSSCDVPYETEEGTRVNVESNCPGYELKCRYNEKYLKVEQNENGEYVINYVKYYPFSTDFLDYFVEFYFVAEDEEVEDNKYSFTLYPTCTKYVGLNKTDISLKKGKKATLKTTVLGATKATFTTSNTKVVKIVKKKAKMVVIKGIKKGTAVITASAAGKSAKCNVVVK